MVQIKYTNIESLFKDSDNKELPRVYLIFGENFLVRQTRERVSDLIIGKDKASFSIETLDGTSASMGDLIEQVSTLSFFTPKKLIVVTRAPLFMTGTPKPGETYYSPTELEHLSSIIASGIPDNHYLLLTVPGADKRKKIYKSLQKNGLAIDCSVPQGSRKADLDEQHRVLLSVAGQILKKADKTMNRQTFTLLADQTGFNIDLLVQNLKKLIAYTGTRTAIESTDIKRVIQRDKKDPIFNLTNAFMDKDAGQCLRYLDSLLNEGYHLLQILKSLENQIRKLLMAKAAARTFSGALNFGAMNFNTFRQSVLPGIVKHDAIIKETAQHPSAQWSAESKKKKNPSELLLAPNPKNAYPVFQLFLKSARFSYHELQDLITYLSDLDSRLKSSSVDIRTLIEQMILRTCRKGGFVYAAEDKDRRHHF